MHFSMANCLLINAFLLSVPFPDRTNKDMDIRRMILNGKLEGLDFLKEKDDMYCDGTTPLMYAVINENSQAVTKVLSPEFDVEFPGEATSRIGRKSQRGRIQIWAFCATFFLFVTV